MSDKIAGKNKEKIDRKLLGAELAGKVREFYPYFFGFYLLALFISLWSKIWRSFFFWPAFHGAIAVFTILFIISSRRKILSYFPVNQEKEILKVFFISARGKSRKFFFRVWLKLLSIKKRDWLKITVIVTVLVFALFKSINPLEFLILLYALISFLFVLDSRYAAGVAIAFLIFCPFLLTFKKDILAQSAAVYAYYFLVITVLTQMRELARDKKAGKDSE